MASQSKLLMGIRPVQGEAPAAVTHRWRTVSERIAAVINALTEAERLAGKIFGSFELPG